LQITENENRTNDQAAIDKINKKKQKKQKQADETELTEKA
jgi:hypothetical protein